MKRLKAVVVAALSDNRTTLDIKLCQLVKLMKNGEPFKMSKRAGTFVTLRDVVEQVGPDVARFTMLTRKNDAPLEFDFAKALEQSKDNPVFYVQYAHARVQSVLRRAGEAGIAADDATLAAADLTRLGHEAELKLARQIAEFPREVEIAARGNETAPVSPSTFTNWPLTCIRCGTAGMMTCRCASSRMAILPRLRPRLR